MKSFTKPNDKYFDHIEALVDMADSLGLQIGLLPRGVTSSTSRGPGPVIFDTEEKAENYGKYVGKRFGQKEYHLILGGDRPADGCEKYRPGHGPGMQSASGQGLFDIFDDLSSLGGTSCTKWFTDEPGSILHAAERTSLRRAALGPHPRRLQQCQAYPAGARREPLYVMNMPSIST